MTDPFEKFVRQNKAEFDVHKPSADLFDKINPPKEAKVIKLNWAATLGKAAAIILLCISSVVIYELVRPGDVIHAGNKTDEVKTDPVEIPELAEAEAFYTTLIATHIEDLKQYDGFNAELEAEVTADFEELDIAYDDLMVELGDNPDNTEIIEALIQNFRIRLSILERILENIEKADTKNKQSNEEFIQA